MAIHLPLSPLSFMGLLDTVVTRAHKYTPNDHGYNVPPCCRKCAKFELKSCNVTPPTTHNRVVTVLRYYRV